MRKLVLALLAVGLLVFLLRVCRRRREHIDLYYDDGSMVSLKPGTVRGWPGGPVRKRRAACGSRAGRLRPAAAGGTC